MESKLGLSGGTEPLPAQGGGGGGGTEPLPAQGGGGGGGTSTQRQKDILELMRSSYFYTTPTIKDEDIKRQYQRFINYKKIGDEEQKRVEKDKIQTTLDTAENIDLESIYAKGGPVNQIRSEQEKLHKNYQKLRENLGISIGEKNKYFLNKYGNYLEPKKKKLGKLKDFKTRKLNSLQLKKFKLIQKDLKLSNPRNQIEKRINELEKDIPTYGSKDPTKKLLEEELEQKKIQLQEEKEKVKFEKERVKVEKERVEIEQEREGHKYKSYELSKIKKEIKKAEETSNQEEVKKLKSKEEDLKVQIGQHSDNYKEKLKNFKSNLVQKVDETKSKIKKLRGKGEKTKKDEKELKELHHHLKHLEREEKDVKKHHTKDSIEENDNETGWERFMRINESDEMSAFIFFCSIAVFVFIVTAFFAYNNSTYNSSNKSIKEYTHGIIYSGIVYFILFVTIIAIGFGKDKDVLEKIASFVLIAGSIFMGVFFSYLKSQDDFQNLTSSESLASSVAVAVTYLFILFAIYYDLFEKNQGKISNDMRSVYAILSVLFFLGIGSFLTYLTFSTDYSEDSNLKFLLPLSSGLFFLGLIGVIIMITSYFKNIDSILDAPLEIALDFIDMPQFKIIIMGCFIASIYYTYLLYQSYNSPDVRDARDSSNQLTSKGKLIEESFVAGVCLVSFFLLMLGICFGGTVKEKIFATLLIVFIVFIGSLLLWLDGEDKINVSGTTRGMLTATEIVFIVLTFLMIYYVLFAAQSSRGKIIMTLAKLIIQVSGIIFFLYAFGMITYILFDFDAKGKIKDELWAGFGVGLLVILVSFVLIFFL